MSATNVLELSSMSEDKLTVEDLLMLNQEFSLDSFDKNEIDMKTIRAIDGNLHHYDLAISIIIGSLKQKYNMVRELRKRHKKLLSSGRSADQKIAKKHRQPLWRASNAG